jgi:hypothetical protein
MYDGRCGRFGTVAGCLLKGWAWLYGLGARRMAEDFPDQAGSCVR